jgi:hypothetical protein
MMTTIPFANQLDADISLSLVENRQLPLQERIQSVKHQINHLDFETLLHYASAGLVCRDVLIVQLGRTCDEIFPAALHIAKSIGDNLEKRRRKASSTKATDALHGKVGGSRDKQSDIRALWASGKFKSRDFCAEQECAGLNMSFSAARKALRNTPEPS